MRVSVSAAERLALEGGKPVRSKLLPYGHHSVEESDIASVVETLRSDWLTTGPKVEEFENAIAEFVGAQYAVAFSSGTAALHGAVFAADLNGGDEAITTPLTFCATANAVLYQDARPVLADVSPDTLNLDPQAAAQRITPQTKAILPVDFTGHPAALDEILRIAGERITVIEDASHALGATYKQRRVGGISHMSTFSFHPVKHVACGEGGMVTTNNQQFARRLRQFRNHGIESDARRREIEGQWHYEMTALGYNYRLSDIACALGLSQLNRIQANVARRRAIAARYQQAFAEIAAIETPHVRPEVEPAWHLYCLRLRLERLTADRTQIFRALRGENIGVNVHYIPVHLHPYYRERFGHGPGEFPVAEDAYQRLVTLPMFPAMSDGDVEDVVLAVRKVMAAYSA
jgi:UDP-4-amino-4,6-dideoxy-N-acetyl-beta-L-altrosamine transaminase